VQAVRPIGPAAPPAKSRDSQWLDSLARGYTQAQQKQRPIFVRVGSETCRFCRELSVQLEQPAIQEELKRWVLVAIDVDKSPDDARLLAVGPIPALLALTVSGRVVASEEGAMSASDLLKWLKDNFDLAATIPPDDLDTEEAPDAAAVGRLIQAFRNRDAVIREAVIRKLLPHPDVAAAQVVEAFSDGSLAMRLSALDLLVEWKAPAEGLDPWRKETLTAERLNALAEWGASARIPEPAKLSPADLAEAHQIIEHMTIAQAGEAQVMRERLARYGRLLLPEVYDRLKTAATDEIRERLTMLRYRLVEAQSLALHWPGGIERLAAQDSEIRIRAAGELAARATSADEPLLLELFSDPAPLVREITMRALRQAGGSNVNSALLGLLDDPEPNVRAAVLKQLAEAPSAAVAARIATYVAAETDPDLVVHAVRVLREIPGNTTKDAIVSLLGHASWRVRAEAVESLGKKIPRYGNQVQPEHLEIYTLMLDLLKDEDGFVVSRSVETLAHADLVAAVEPLVAAAETHPELAVEVVKALAYGQKQRNQAEKHLRRFADHTDPRLRAAAIIGLTTNPGVNLADDMRKALADPNSEVRIAAANGLFGILENRRRSEDTNILTGVYRDAAKVGDPQEKEPPDEAESPDNDETTSLPDETPPPRPARSSSAAPATGKSIFDTLKTVIKVATGQPVIATEEFPPQPAQSDEKLPDESTFSGRDRADEWLRVIRTGKIIPKSQRELRPALEPLLAADDPQEKVAGLLPLTALGADELTLPAMQRLIETEPRLVSRLSEALPWLLATDRQKVLERMLAGPVTHDDLATISSNLAETHSPQAEQALWNLIAHPEADLAAAETVKSSLIRFYFPRHTYQLEQAPVRDRNRAIAAATARAKTGTSRQRLVGLALLLSLERETAREIARPVFEDKRAPLDERGVALQILLITLPEAEGVRLAVAQFAGTHIPFRGPALALLVGDQDTLHSIEEGAFNLSAHGWSGSSHFNSNSGEPIVPEAPTGLTPEPLLPLLKSENPRVAAQAGYLAALLGRDEGLAPLIAYWRTKAVTDHEWTRFVYRAITSLNDGAQVPLLREIYANLNTENNRHYLTEFYWTIRSMTAPEVLPLRKTIRDEVGLQNLR
jgi:HEAT repeat protein